MNNLDIVITTEANNNAREEIRIILSLKNFLEKFDASGDTLFSLTRFSTKHMQEYFLNVK
jgi:hypothetical protein